MINKLNLFENEKLKVIVYYSITKLIFNTLKAYNIGYSSDSILNVLSTNTFNIYVTIPMFYDFNNVFTEISNELNEYNVKIHKQKSKVPFNVNYISITLTFEIEDIDLVAGYLKLKKLIVNPKIFTE